MNSINRSLAMHYQSTNDALFAAAEKLPLKELRQRVRFYEKTAKELEIMKGLKGILSRFFLSEPIILDNVNPLHGGRDIYLVAKEVLEFKEKYELFGNNF